MRYRSNLSLSPFAKPVRLLAVIGLLAMMVVGSACSDDEEPPADETAPQISAFSAEPTSVTAGQSATLSWTITDADAATITVVDGDFSHTVAQENIASGTLEVTPEATTTYVLTATAGELEATEQVEITVEAAVSEPTIDSFEASPTDLIEGESTTLSWTTTDADELALVDADGNSIDLSEAGVDSGSVDVSPTESTTYTLTASNDAGSDEQTVSVTVAVEVTVDLQASSESITVGDSTTLSWTTTGDVETVALETGDGTAIDVSGESAAAGSVSVSPTEDTTYTITVSGGEQTAQASVSIEVLPVAPTINSFSVSPNPAVAGGTATISWDVTGAESLTVESATDGTIDLSGISLEAGTIDMPVPEQETVVYTLTAENAGGTTTQDFTLTTGEAVTISSFTSNAGGPVVLGDDVTLSWTVANATDVTLESDITGAIDISNLSTPGQITLQPQQTTTYTLTAQGLGGPATQTLTVDVVEPVAISDFTVNPTSIESGSQVTISWTTVAATGLTLEALNGSGSTPIDVSSLNVASDSVTHTPASDVIAYKLSAAGPNGPAVEQQNVTVFDPVTIDTFTADTTTTVSGEAVTLSWTTTDGTALTITGDNGVTNYTAASGEIAAGTLQVRPQTTTVYTLTLDGPNSQQTTATVTVTVDAANIVLSEVVYDVAGGDDTFEWIEVYNAGDTFVDLSNYSMGGGGTDYTYSQLDLSGTLAPQGCAVFGGPGSNADNANPVFFDGTGTDIVNDLQNGGSTADGVALFFATSANVTATTTPIDSVLYGGANNSALLGEDGSADTELSPDVSSGSSLARVSPTSDVFVERTSPTPGRCFNVSSVSQASAPVDASGPITLEGFGLDPTLDQYELEDDSGTAFVLTGCTETSEDVVECTVPALTTASSDPLDLVITRNLEYTADADGNPTATAAAQAQTYRLAAAYSPAYTINWCNVQFPQSTTLAPSATETVYGQLYIAGYTDAQATLFDSPSIVSELGVGPDGTDPATATGWTWAGASANAGFDFTQNNDEYQATLTAPATTGDYDYAYRFSGDAGQTWTYCDTTGPGDGYNAADAGQLSVQ